MVLQDDADRVKHLLAEAISVLCKNGLSFETGLSVEGLLGITLDNSDIFLVNINETITNEGRKQQQKSSTKSRVSASRDKSPEDRHEKSARDRQDKSPRDRQEKSPRDRHGRKRGREAQTTSPEPSAKRTTRAGRHSNVDPIDIKKEKLSVADDASSYGGDDTGHDDDTPEEMKCTRCGKMFDNPANLERHLKEIHFVGVVWLCCQNCDFSHVSMKHFNYHMFRLHRKVGGRKRFPQELKFLTPERIKYRIEHNMRVPDISDNMPRPAAEKSGPSSSTLRRTPARLSANASKKLERPLARTTDKPRVTIKAEPNGKSAPRSLRHRDGAGQVVLFSKDRKGSLRRRSAPPAPSTPRTAKPIPKPVPKVTPKPVAPKVVPKITPKVTPKREEKKSTPRREEKKATPKRVEKKATPRRAEKKATPKRDDRKKTPLSKDTKKTPTSSKKTDQAVVKKKPIVPPKKVQAKKSPLKEQKSAKRKSSSKKIIWPAGVSVKDFEIKLNPVDLSAINIASKKPEVEGLEKTGEPPKNVDVEKSIEILEKSGESPEKAAVEKALEILSKDDEQESPASPGKSRESDTQEQSKTASTGEKASTGESNANKTGETQPDASTDETQLQESVDESQPEASTGEAQPKESTGEVGTAASTSEIQSQASKGETDMNKTGETQSKTSTGEAQPEASTGEAQPEVSTGETQPKASTDEMQPEASTGEAQPETSTGETRPEASTDEANTKVSSADEGSQKDGNAEQEKEGKSSPTKTLKKAQELGDNQDQVSSEQVSSTTVEDKETESVEEGSGERTKYSEREVEAVGSSEPMETDDVQTKYVETSESEMEKSADTEGSKEKLPSEEVLDDSEKEQVASPDDDIEKSTGIEQISSPDDDIEKSTGIEQISSPDDDIEKSTGIEQISSPDDDIEKSTGIEQISSPDEAIEQGDKCTEDVDQGEKEDVDDNADVEAGSQREGQGDEEMETDAVQDDAEMAAFRNGDGDNANLVTDTSKQDEQVIASLVPDQEKKGLSPRAKDISTAAEHQFTADEPIQRIAEDLMSEAAVLEPGAPAVLDEHVTSSQQSEHLGGDGEVDVAALLGEINTMNQ